MPPDELEDAWWYELFERPPEERDTADVPRVRRMLEARHIRDKAKLFTDDDLAKNLDKIEKLRESDHELWELITNALEAGRAGTDR